MQKLTNYVQDRWIEGEGVEAELLNPSTEEVLCTASAAGIDRAAMLDHARTVGGPMLRSMTYGERGAMIEAVSSAIHGAREELIGIALDNGGNTRGDAKFDIDGAIGTLANYASLGKRMGDERIIAEGEAIDMGRSSRMQGRHLLLPRQGAAIHINAFNFPSWGFAEKAACAWLAGMPVVVKPGTVSAQLAHRVVEIIIDKDVLPKGALSLLCGRVGDLLDHVDFQDCVAFTGSAATGSKVRAHPVVLERGCRVNVEADSINCAVLGADVTSDSETWDLFIRDVVTDMTQKAGQKCTAIRRTVVPEERVDEVRDRLAEELGRITVGNPREDGVRMGPLASPGAFKDAKAALERLLEVTTSVFGGGDANPVGVSDEKGYFMAPTILKANTPLERNAVHEVEVFGPVSTILPYDGTADQAGRIARLGGGGLVASFYTDDRSLAASLLGSMGPFQGRLVWGSAKMAGAAPGPGAVFPQFVHGGPGRAGAGEELGGMRGVGFYSQRVAIQGSGPLIDRLVGIGKKPKA